ncbi:MAG: antibiotic biosynthesis monooxygenase family protein [Blastocatellia bacterium]
MIVEYIRYTIPLERGAEFESAYAQAQTSLDASPQCLSYELSRCTEEPSSYVLRIEWESAGGAPSRLPQRPTVPRLLRRDQAVCLRHH